MKSNNPNTDTTMTPNLPPVLPVFAAPLPENDPPLVYIGKANEIKWPDKKCDHWFTTDMDYEPSWIFDRSFYDAAWGFMYIAAPIGSDLARANGIGGESSGNSGEVESIKPDEGLTIDDYEECFESHRALVREIDGILFGENAAKQASLCDLVHPIRKLKQSEQRLRAALEEAIKLIKDQYQWEPITAESRETDEQYFGARRNMPNDMVELDNQTGIPPEEMADNLKRLEAALAPASSGKGER